MLAFAHEIYSAMTASDKSAIALCPFKPPAGSGAFTTANTRIQSQSCRSNAARIKLISSSGSPLAAAPTATLLFAFTFKSMPAEIIIDKERASPSVNMSNNGEIFQFGYFSKSTPSYSNSCINRGLMFLLRYAPVSVVNNRGGLTPPSSGCRQEVSESLRAKNGMYLSML